MNLVKAADDIKNLSDQQLLSAGQNPVMVPPYLVLAEMKRREQLRAQYAKAQQQQQQPSVAQQVAQNLTQPQGQPQGQPQQGAPQQPPPQGIMQAAPPQAMAMAGGGHVARYAEGTPRTNPLDQFLSSSAEAMRSLQGMNPREQEYKAPAGLSLDVDQIKGQFQQRPISEYLGRLDELQGKPDYSSAQALVEQQMKQAQQRKPRIGDALIAAGAAMASNRDNRVGLANLLAQAIGVGSQTYDTAKREQQKELNAAMMAKVALDKMKQDEFQKRVSTALQMAQGDQNKLVEAYKVAQQNQRYLESQRSKAQSEQDKRRFDLSLEGLKLNQKAIEVAYDYQIKMQMEQMGNASREKVAGMNIAAENARSSRERTVPESTRALDLTKVLGSRLESLNEQMKTAIGMSPQERANLVSEIAATQDQYKKALAFATQAAAGLGIQTVDMSGYSPSSRKVR